MILEWFSDVAYRVQALFRRAAFEREMDAEFRDHITRARDALLARGLSEAEATRRARIAFGGVTQMKETHREARGILAVDQLLQDLRYAARALRANPGFTLAASLTLALGIGASTAIFGALDALLLQPLPVRSPSRLVTLEQIHPDGSRQYNLSYLDFERFKAFDALAGIAAVSWGEVFNTTVSRGQAIGDARGTHVSAVTGTYFSVLGLHAAVGRLISADDDRDASEAAIVLSDAFWTRRFARAGDVVGRTLVLNGHAFTIVGVMQPEFGGDWVGWPTDAWIPSAHIAALHPEMSSGDARTRFQYKVIGRLADGVELSQAQRAGDAFYEQVQRDPPSNSGISPRARFELASAATGYSPQREVYARPLFLLMTIVGAVLLIACANTTNLLLARAAAREREMALRVSLGAGRSRIVRQLMTETVMLALLGGLAGTAIALVGWQFLEALVRSGPVVSLAGNANPVTIDLPLRVGARTLAFTALVCLTTTVVVGLVPALCGVRVDLLPALGVGGRRAASGGRELGRGALVILQVALSLILLVTTGLFARTLRNLANEQLGFDRQNVLLVWTLPGQLGAPPRDIATLWDAVQDHVGSLPGVSMASISVEGVLSGAPVSGPLMLPVGGAMRDSVRVQSTMTVAPNFFAAVGQALVAGRDFARTDTDSSPDVVIVNRALARRLFGEREAVGRKVLIRGASRPLEIIGVVADAKPAPRYPYGPAAYYPPRQNFRRLSRGMVLVVRTTSNPLSLARSIRRVLSEVAPTLPVVNIDTADEQLDRTLFSDRLVAVLSTAFGVVALLLACVGLFGLMSYLASRRTREIGVSMALGATRSRVISSMMRQSLALVAVGAVTGVVALTIVTRAVRSMLFGVAALDPLTIAAALGLLVACAAVATLIPAYRASRIDPATALRAD